MNIFNLIRVSLNQKLQRKSFENILIKGLELLDENIKTEIVKYVKSQQNTDGGFKDKAGNSDVYYSFFGYLLCKVLNLNENQKDLRNFIEKKALKENHKDVDLLCLAILYNELGENNETLKFLKKQVKNILFKTESNNNQYSLFLGLITFYYLKDYKSILHLSKIQKKQSIIKEKTTPVLSAELVLAKFSSLKTQALEETIKARVQKYGGFKASGIAPLADLLSTAVALYSLNFIHSDLIAIKPENLEFVNSLYENGGFVATEIDNEADIEYTFYGLLALGALNNN